jgi:hypothetical protein
VKFNCFIGIDRANFGDVYVRADFLARPKRQSEATLRENLARFYDHSVGQWLLAEWQITEVHLGRRNYLHQERLVLLLQEETTNARRSLGCGINKYIGHGRTPERQSHQFRLPLFSGVLIEVICHPRAPCNRITRLSPP